MHEIVEIKQTLIWPWVKKLSVNRPRWQSQKWPYIGRSIILSDHTHSVYVQHMQQMVLHVTFKYTFLKCQISIYQPIYCIINIIPTCNATSVCCFSGNPPCEYWVCTYKVLRWHGAIHQPHDPASAWQMGSVIPDPALWTRANWAALLLQNLIIYLVQRSWITNLMQPILNS